MGAVDAERQAGVQDQQTVGGHWIPGRRPQDGLQRNGHAGTGQPCVSPHEHEHLRLSRATISAPSAVTTAYLFRALA